MWTILLSSLILSLSPGVLPTPVKILFLFFTLLARQDLVKSLTFFFFAQFLYCCYNDRCYNNLYFADFFFSISILQCSSLKFSNEEEGEKGVDGTR